MFNSIDNLFYLFNNHFDWVRFDLYYDPARVDGFDRIVEYCSDVLWVGGHSLDNELLIKIINHPLVSSEVFGPVHVLGVAAGVRRDFPCVSDSIFEKLCIFRVLADVFSSKQYGFEVGEECLELIVGDISKRISLHSCIIDFPGNNPILRSLSGMAGKSCSPIDAAIRIYHPDHSVFDGNMLSITIDHDLRMSYLFFMDFFRSEMIEWDMELDVFDISTCKIAENIHRLAVEYSLADTLDISDRSDGPYGRPLFGHMHCCVRERLVSFK